MGYFYPEDLKTFENMLSTDNLVGLYFEYGNVMDFWIIGLIVVETEETLAKNIVSWVKNNLENG